MTDFPTRAVRPPREPTPPATDRYALGRVLGEGGMGTVYQATDRDTGRPVAVKLLRADVASPAYMARFELERQALARMDHPHIARLLDAGTAADGRPFYAMEFVDGTPLTRYCDTRQLPLADRLGLFALVCRAVHHAHTKGVIHRDIKPTNVLVAEIDGRPFPKIIDFGLAKGVRAGELAAAARTQTGMVIGTPQYMAPEQAAGDPADVDTRADVYALGVVLYELLTGQPPLPGRTTPLPELLRKLAEDDPERPSARLSGTADLQAVAAARRTDPHTLLKTAAGDLGWIALKALDRDRDRRYESAAALADDVRRWLADEPVTAGRPSLAYRAGKFVRRNRAMAAGAAVAAVALAGGTAAAVAGLVRARQAEALALARLDEAEAARAEAERAADRLRTEAALDALDRRAAHLYTLDRYAEAVPLIEQVVARAEAVYGPEHTYTVRRRRSLAHTYKHLGRTADWAAALERTVADGRAAYGPGSPLMVGEALELARHLADTGRPADAAALADEFRSVLLGPVDLRGNNGDRFEQMEELARLYSKAGRTDPAIELLSAAAAGRQREQPTAWDIEYTRSRMAEVLTAAGRYAEAEPHAVESFDRLLGRQADIGTSYPKIMWRALDRVVRLYDAWDKPEKAAEWRARGLAVLPREVTPKPRKRSE